MLRSAICQWIHAKTGFDVLAHRAEDQSTPTLFGELSQIDTGESPMGAGYGEDTVHRDSITGDAQWKQKIYERTVVYQLKMNANSTDHKPAELILDEFEELLFTAARDFADDFRNPQSILDGATDEHVTEIKIKTGKAQGRDMTEEPILYPKLYTIEVVQRINKQRTVDHVMHNFITTYAGS